MRTTTFTGKALSVAIDGKTRRRSSKVGETPLHWVSAFAAGVGLALLPSSRTRRRRSHQTQGRHQGTATYYRNLGSVSR